MSFKLLLLLSVFFHLSVINTVAAQFEKVDTEVVELNIFPNPNSGTFYITLVNEESHPSKLFGMDGKLVREIYLNNGLNYVSINVKPGIYILKVENGDTEEQFRIQIN